MNKTCKTCIWFEDGYLSGESWRCMTTKEHVDPDETCPFWQKTLRSEPLVFPEVKETK